LSGELLELAVERGDLVIKCLVAAGEQSEGELARSQGAVLRSGAEAGSAAHQLDARESSQLVAQLRWCGDEQRAERVNRLSASFHRRDAQDADHFDDVITAIGRRRCLTRQNRPACCLGVGRIRFALATARLAVSAHHLDHADVLRAQVAGEAGSVTATALDGEDDGSARISVYLTGSSGGVVTIPA
jgi:hypothetical protein